jgi:hypothetical protein
MAQHEAIQVSTTRANEIFQGKALSTIQDLMVENSQVSAVAEQLSQELQRERAAHMETKLKLGAAMGAQSNELPPDTAPPQSS